ncbi:MAG: hypothetical protein IKO63_00425 [Paludibacteraceae bacterium]|nr:hypothetical protein [Paludibacteraceae bacterium]
MPVFQSLLSLLTTASPRQPEVPPYIHLTPNLTQPDTTANTQPDATVNTQPDATANFQPIPPHHTPLIGTE